MTVEKLRGSGAIQITGSRPDGSLIVETYYFYTVREARALFIARHGKDA